MPLGCPDSGRPAVRQACICRFCDKSHTHRNVRTRASTPTRMRAGAGAHATVRKCSRMPVHAPEHSKAHVQ
eukprot:3791054-Alexandrium_andersonii.AAC.1